jgi:hypothetical protein
MSGNSNGGGLAELRVHISDLHGSIVSHENRLDTTDALLGKIRDTFITGGVDPSDPASRDRFGLDHRWVRLARESHEARAKWLGAAMGAICISVLTALVLTFGPQIVRLFLVAGVH